MSNYTYKVLALIAPINIKKQLTASNENASGNSDCPGSVIYKYEQICYIPFAYRLYFQWTCLTTENTEGMMRYLCVPKTLFQIWRPK
jgi:hypothetical protein